MKLPLLTILIPIPIFIFAAFAAGSIYSTEVGKTKLLITESSSVPPVPAPTSVAPILAEMYGNVSIKEEQKRLKELAATLKKKEFEPATLCIIAYAEQKGFSEMMMKKAARAKNYLIKKQKIDPNRFHIIDGGHRKKSTLLFYILPPGASPPSPDPDEVDKFETPFH